MHQTRLSAARSYLATCIPGLSNVMAAELTELGADQVVKEGSSAVRFQANLRTALSTVIHLRTAHKVMELLSVSEPTINDRDTLSSFCRESVNVKDLLGDGQGGLLTIAVSASLNKAYQLPSDINHSHYTALSVKNALCDEVRALRGDRPSVDTDMPQVPLTIALLGTSTGAQVSLYRQLHVGSLHRRGYRPGAIHKAAMKESLAAGLLLASGWPNKKDYKVLLDPMCGSGSLLLEAAMMAANLAPGLMRIRCGLPGATSPAVLAWKHDEDATLLWRDLLLEATAKAKIGLQELRSSNMRFMGNDLHEGALALTETSLSMAGLSDLVDLRLGDCRDWRPDVEGSWMVATNPPWGERLDAGMEDAWEALRVFLRETCPPSSEAWVLSGNAAATKHLGLRKSQSVPIKTGQQDLRWLQYEIHDKDAPRPRPSPQPKATVLRKGYESRGKRSEVSSARPTRPITETNRPNQSKPSKSKTAPAKADSSENEWLI